MSAAIATEVQRIVRDAASPVLAGDTIKAQLRRAWSNLGKPAFWRVRAGWYGEAAPWSAAALEEFRARYRAWRDKQEARGCVEADIAVRRLMAVRDALSAVDPHFHRETLASIEHALRGMGQGVGAVDVSEE